MSPKLNLIGYGAFELKQAYQKNLGLGLMLASLFHMAVVLGLMFYAHAAAKPIEAKGPPAVYNDSTFYPPPVITLRQVTPIPVAGPDAFKPTIGIPKPVPDTEAREGATIASQGELDQITASDLKGFGEGTGESIRLETKQPEILPQPEELVPYDESPVPLSEGEYEYPPLARQAGIEGTVWIKALVDKNGDVRDAFVFKPSGTSLGFEEEAKQGAFKIKYKPAISNHQPVAVWVVYAVCFKLK
ncbi:MAG: TonB family protein [Candidatus Zixiibacteriota bacterium]